MSVDFGDLFKYGAFKLHSGHATFFKIDCDALSDGDLKTLAILIKEALPPFGVVEGVPSGGIRLAAALEKLKSPYSQSLLIVDDVLTTGTSMEDQRGGREAQGVVIFARGTCPDWVWSIFQMDVDE